MSLNTKEVYLDNSATTPVLPDIADRIRSVMVDEFGNPSSSHSKGVLAESLITEARKNISQALEVKNKEIFFTSGGTESNNWALVSAALSRRRRGDHIICSSIEHPSVLEVVKYLGQNGFKVDYCPVNRWGIIEPDVLADLVNPGTVLVSIMLVNNEIGSVQPIKDLVKVCKNKNPNIIFHSDCVQAVGKVQVYPRQMGVDLISMSAHKIHGPKGAGALFVKEGTNLRSIIYGGGQELGFRSGTENVPGIVGFGMALKRAIGEQNEISAQAAPHIINLSFAGVRGEVLARVLEADQIYVSTGSACTSRKTKTSHVLKAIGLSDQEAAGSIRISLSGLNTREDMEHLAEALKHALEQLVH